MPLISVLLPVKNRAHTLTHAVASTLRAMPKDAELVVLDDASTDDVSGALSEFADPRLRLLRNRTSLGIGPARQLLLDSTDSRYVASMDADDVGLLGRFRLQLHALKAADMVFSPIVSFARDPLRLRPGLPLPISAEAMPLHMLVHNLLCNPTMAAKREAILAAGGYRSVPAEDHDLWLRALAAGQRLARTSLPVLAYRHHEGQASVQDGFIVSALGDARLREAYVGFVERCFGVSPTWLDALWSSESGTPSVRAELGPLRALLADRSRNLDLVQRLVLVRTTRLLDERVKPMEGSE